MDRDTKIINLFIFKINNFLYKRQLRQKLTIIDKTTEIYANWLRKEKWRSGLISKYNIYNLNKI